MPVTAASKSGSMRPCAQGKRKVRGRAAVERRRRRLRALEVDGDPVAVCGRAIRRLVGRALLAQDLDGAIDLGIADRARRALDLDARTGRPARSPGRPRRSPRSRGPATLDRLARSMPRLRPPRAGCRPSPLELNASPTASPITSAWTCGAVGLRDHLHRHLAGPEAGHLHGARTAWRRRSPHFLVDRLGRYGQVEPALKRAEGFQVCCILSGSFRLAAQWFCSDVLH